MHYHSLLTSISVMINCEDLILYKKWATILENLSITTNGNKVNKGLIIC